MRCRLSGIPPERETSGFQAARERLEVGSKRRVVGLEAAGTVEAEILLIEVGVDLGLVSTRDFQLTGAHHTGDQLGTSDLLQPDEFEAERFDDGEQAIQRGTVDQRTRQDGVVALCPRAEAGKRGTEGSAEAAADTDLIVLL